MRLSIVRLCSLVSLLACAGDKDGAGDEGGGSSGGSSGGSGGSGGGEAEAVCAAPTVGGEATHGDANNDGLIDISDSVMTFRYLVAGGAAPYCADAMDFIHDDLLDLSDATSLLYVLFGADGELPSYNLDCDSPTAVADAACGVFDLSLDVSETLSGPAGQELSATVGVLLRAPDLEVQGWSLGVSASGCSLTGISEDGTAIADRRLDTEGRRDMGWSRGDAVDGGVVHSGLVSWAGTAGLEAREEAWRLVNLSLTATAPASGCETCTLTPTGALTGPGPVVPLIVASGGRSYTPTTTAATVQICAE